MAGNKIPHISASFVILFILYLQSLFGETLLILFLASGFTTYFLLGDIWQKWTQRRIQRRFWDCWEVLMIVLTQVFEESIPESYNYTYDNHSILLLMYSLGVFVLFYKKEVKVCKVVSKYTFGIGTRLISGGIYELYPSIHFSFCFLSYSLYDSLICIYRCHMPQRKDSIH